MQTPQEIITNCFQEQSVRIISDIFENSESDLLSMEQVIENFKKMWGASDTIIGNAAGSSSSSPKPKKITKKTIEKAPRKRAIVPDNLRCIARKKDGDRCAAKAYAGGRNPKICTLHNNKGANFGMIIEEPEIKESDDEELETNENKSVSSKLSKEEAEELFGEVSSDNEEIF